MFDEKVLNLENGKLYCYLIQLVNEKRTAFIVSCIKNIHTVGVIGIWEKNVVLD